MGDGCTIATIAPNIAEILRLGKCAWGSNPSWQARVDKAGNCVISWIGVSVDFMAYCPLMNVPHTLIDERSRAMDRLVADKIQANPSLMTVVRAQLNHKLQVHRDSGCRQAALEWEEILNTWPLERVLAFIQEDSERANRLRQSTPFIGILSEEERQEVYRRYDPRAA